MAYDQIHYYQLLYACGDYSVVEGVITEYVPVSQGNGGIEMFRVANVDFDVRTKESPPNFRQTVAQGNSLHDGLAVRIHYADRYGGVYGPAILRIEIKQ